MTSAGAGSSWGPVIDSASNSTIQMLRDLHDAAGRREHGAFLVEGERLVAEAVEVSWPLLVVIYDAKRAGEDPFLASLVARIPTAIPATARAIKHSADTVTPQGIVAAARLPAQAGAIDPHESLVVVLDGVSDPGNAGTLLRSALGSGVRTVLATRGSADLFAPKVIRGGMGAHFRLKLGTAVAWEIIPERLGRERPVVVAHQGAGTPYHLFDWRLPAALVVGSEARGVGTEAQRLATEMVMIPLAPGVESLNAGVAGSILMFEAKRQRDLEVLRHRT